MTDTLTTIRLGYGGLVILNGASILATSGSMENNVTPAYTSGYNMPNDTSSRSRILHSDGTVTHTGSVGFDLTTSGLSAIRDLMTRNHRFGVTMYDGQFGMSMTNCAVESISMSGAPAGLISASVNFSSDTPANKLNSSFSINCRDCFIGEIIPYWWSGNSYVREWTLTFNQSVAPRFANLNKYSASLQSEGILASSPLYLFVGEIDVRLDFTTFCPLVTDTVHVSTDSFQIVGRTTGSGYTLSGQNELPTYKYSISSHAVGLNNAGVLTIG